MDHLLIRTTKGGGWSTLLLAIHTKTGAVRRTTSGPFRKRTNSDPDYHKWHFQAPSTLVRIIFGRNQKVILTNVNGA